MNRRWDYLLSVVLIGCALVTTALAVRRELSPSTSATQAAAEKTVFVRDWQSDLKRGVLIGRPGAPVQLMEFADFECPFCGSYHKVLKALRDHYPTQVSLTFVHFPLEGHRFAVPAARAAECANAQGRFEAMYDQLFDGQSELGLKPWGDYAAAAGVPELALFDACIKKNDPIPHVEEGKALGDKFDVHGTPTIVVNGWKLGRPPNKQQLEQMVERTLSGKQPVDGKS